MKTIKNKKNAWIQFAEYMISGGAWFWVGYGAFAFMDLALGVSFWYAKIGSYFVGASVNFLLQKFWVFKQQKNTKQDLGNAAKRYYSLMFGNFVLDQAIVGGLREIGITPYIGQFLAAGFFTGWNWLWYSKWVFVKQSKSQPKKQHAPVLHRQKKVRTHSVKNTHKKKK